MNHNDTREHTEDVVTSQQNELLYDQFRREECKDGSEHQLSASVTTVVEWGGWVICVGWLETVGV